MPAVPKAHCTLPEDRTVLFLCERRADFGPQALQLACNFYGFRLNTNASPDTLDTGKDSEAPLVAIHAPWLASQSTEVKLKVDEYVRNTKLPIALLDVSEENSVVLSQHWCGDATIQAHASAPGSSLWVEVNEKSEFGYELRQTRFPLKLGATQFRSQGEPRLSCLASVGIDEKTRQTTLFRTNLSGRRYVAGSFGRAQPNQALPDRRQVLFGEIAAFLLIIRDALGPACWHRPMPLANLTIDDPRLIQPFGSLDYYALLAEMKRQSFHATIAFIPWNYDRNSAEVVELLREHPKYFSVAVHGNNHEGYEFFRYEALPGDRQRSAPFEKQARNIRQAVARMEKFRELTGLSYDRVMVFPHGISPAQTLQVLQENGFGGTFNFSNVPLDEVPPTAPEYFLHSVNTVWHDMPAIRRFYPHEYPDETIAADLFLGNPVIFMSHQELFRSAPDAFNPFAAKVNRQQPNVSWTSLGEITKLLHWQRRVGPNRWQVILVSRHARLVNSGSLPIHFECVKVMPHPNCNFTITANGENVPWKHAEGLILFTIAAPAGNEVLVEMHFPIKDQLPVPIQRSGWRNRRLRLIADIRDLVLARMAVGRWMAHFYARHLKSPALKIGRGPRQLVLVWDATGPQPRLRTELLSALAKK